MKITDPHYHETVSAIRQSLDRFVREEMENTDVFLRDLWPELGKIGNLVLAIYEDHYQPVQDDKCNHTPVWVDAGPWSDDIALRKCSRCGMYMPCK